MLEGADSQAFQQRLEQLRDSRRTERRRLQLPELERLNKVLMLIACFIDPIIHQSPGRLIEISIDYMIGLGSI